MQPLFLLYSDENLLLFLLFFRHSAILPPPLYKKRRETLFRAFRRFLFLLLLLLSLLFCKKQCSARLYAIAMRGINRGSRSISACRNANISCALISA